MKHQAEVLLWWLPAGRLMTPDSQSERSICVLSGRWKAIYTYIGFIVLILMKKWRRNVMIRCETWGCRCKRRSVDLLLKHCTGTDGRGYFSWSCLTFTQNKWKQTEPSVKKTPQKHFRGRRSELFHVVSCSQQKMGILSWVKLSSEMFPAALWTVCRGSVLKQTFQDTKWKHRICPDVISVSSSGNISCL